MVGVQPRATLRATVAAGGCGGRRRIVDQDAIDALTEDMMSDYNRDRVVVYNTVQVPSRPLWPTSKQWRIGRRKADTSQA